MKYIIVVLLVVAFIYIVKYVTFIKSSYHKITRNSFISTVNDKGRYGEYLTYERLKRYEKTGGRFLFNVYIPKTEEETTEIDVILVCSKGVFVIESKNFSGWIFGSDDQKIWTQSLPSGRGRSVKEHFYNPVFQNRTHIKCLKNIVGAEIPFYSLIVFSERCELKKVNVTSENVFVIKRDSILPCVSAIFNAHPQDALSSCDIEEIYSKLLPYSQADEETKAQHIENINSKYKQNDEGKIIRFTDYNEKNQHN